VIGGGNRPAIFLHTEPTDMRKSFDSLQAVVKEKLRMDALGGAWFLFVGRDRRRCKVLHWDGTGICVYAKRLEKGRFVAPWASGRRQETVKLSESELLLFLEGSEWVGRVSLSPEPLVLRRPEENPHP